MTAAGTTQSGPSGQISGRSSRPFSAQAAAASGSIPSNQSSHQQRAPNYLSSGSSSIAFQQVKQTQASLARLSRVYQQQQQQVSHTNQPSQQVSKESNSNQQQQQVARCTTFVDCLIRRFKDCFNEDCCTVPMFVVGNLSPGSDGTHLILPPCVSLGRQNINRFAGPKNLRLMNSIRESCRSIEELDLGGNKLTDLIEVYKILQCTPNLKFLNLSENDLSKTSPVAMAANCSSSTSTTSSFNWSSNSITMGRTCLAPINQNQSHQGMPPPPPLPLPPQSIGTRRHSTLGQSTPVTTGATVTTATASTSASRARLTSSRLGDARRLAAAAAVAQSKKTSSSVATKLTSSATTGSLAHRSAAGIRDRAGASTSSVCHTSSRSNLDRVGKASSQRHQTANSSTMNLARSLSSLSAKDVRAASSSLSRLSSHRPITRKTSNLRGAPGCSSSRVAAKTATQNSAQSNKTEEDQQIGDGIKDKPATGVQQRLFDEPINESEDVDMGEQPGVATANAPSSQQATPVTNTNSQVTPNQQQTATSRALSTNQTGNTSFYTIGNRSFGSQQQITMSSQQSATNFRRTFESIKALALNNTGCQWRVVTSILSRMPNLEELHLSLNNYERIDLDTNEFKHPALKRLYLCNNPKLTNWEELDKLLVAFPSLEALSIADCNISQIPENLDRAREWRKLCGLNINGWPIKEWPIIERLNQLPSLIDLKCRNLEILNSIDEPRHHLIARLPKLQRLNGSEIEEREHAEKAFLRFFMTNSHLERPPRFHELYQIHGEIATVDVDVDLSPPSQAHVRVIYLNRNHYLKENEDDIIMSEDFLIKLMDSVEEPSVDSMEVAGDGVNMIEQQQTDHKHTRLFKDEGQEVVAIDVDLRQSVRKFKSIIASLFGLSSQNLILYYIDHEMVGLMGPELIKHNQKKLWNYNVQDGDQFIVEER